MKFSGNLTTLDIDIPAYVRAVDATFEVSMKDFLRRWLIVTTGRIPVFSGMARGTFLSAAQLVNGTVVITGFKAKSRVSQGQALGHAELTVKDGKATFVFSTEVRQLFLDDKPGHSPSSPWGALPTGAASFDEFSKGVKLPDVGPFFVNTPVSI